MHEYQNHVNKFSNLFSLSFWKWMWMVSKLKSFPNVAIQLVRGKCLLSLQAANENHKKYIFDVSVYFSFVKSNVSLWHFDQEFLSESLTKLHGVIHGRSQAGGHRPHTFCRFSKQKKICAHRTSNVVFYCCL